MAQRHIALLDRDDESALLLEPGPRGLHWDLRLVDTNAPTPFFEENLRHLDLEPLDEIVWRILTKRIAVPGEHAGELRRALTRLLETGPHPAGHALDLKTGRTPMTLSLRRLASGPRVRATSNSIWI